MFPELIDQPTGPPERTVANKFQLLPPWRQRAESNQ
jgi:hypothetical protein